MTADELLKKLWIKSINDYMNPESLDTIIEKFSNDKRPFGDTGPALERVLSAGASRRDLGLLLRYAAYCAVFDTLYEIEDPEFDKSDVEGLHESILSADPSGMEGFPGSADGVNPKKVATSKKKKR